MAFTLKQLDEIAAARESAVLDAFFSIIRSVKDSASVSAIEQALTDGDIGRVISILQIDSVTYEPLENEILQSFREGGITGARQLGQIPMFSGDIVARFNIRSLEAEAWASALSSRLVVEIVEKQRESLREVISQSLIDGRNPRETALDIVGRVKTATGRREGGFIGLTQNQTQWIYSARSELESLDRNYFTRELRNKGLDSTIEAYFNDKKAVPKPLLKSAVTDMQSNAELYRGEVIARTESINALRAGQIESFRQAFESSDILDKEVSREWQDTGNDGRTRATHSAADKQTVAGMNAPFLVGGYELMYPGDSSLGAAASETIQCRCRQRVIINFGAQARRMEGFG